MKCFCAYILNEISKMGQTTSTPADAAKPEELKKVMNSSKVLIPQGSETNLGFVKELVNTLSSANNSEIIMKVVNEYNKNIKDEKMKVNVDNLGKSMDVIKNYHNELANSLKGENAPNLSTLNADKRLATLNGIAELKDSPSTYNAIRNLVEKKLGSVKTKMDAFEFFKENTEIKSVVDKIMNGIVDLNARSMFFEYKYISMYIFMTVFIQHMYNTMDKFMGEVVQLNELRNRYRQQANKEIFDAILDAVDKSGVDITEHLKDHDVLVREKAQELQKKIDTVQTDYRNTIEMNMSSLLEFILKNEKQMADSLMKIVQVEQQKQPSVTLQTPQTPLEQRQQFKGGFVKAGSTFPSSFYKCS